LRLGATRKLTFSVEDAVRLALRADSAASGPPDSERPTMDASTPEQIASGSQNAAISQQIVQLHSEYYGKGPTKARTYALNDVVICILRDVFTTVERTLISAGNGDRIRDIRLTFQDTMATRFRSIVEEATGRRVIAFFSQIDVDADMAAEVFVLADGVAESAQRDGSDPLRGA
jgi:uncharacterized protein YbcI